MSNTTSWATLFDRASAYEVTTEEIQLTLQARRKEDE